MALFRAFGQAIATLSGRYITAEDVGSTTRDMHVVQQQTPFVSGIPRPGAFGGDPSPKTAFGVFVAIEEGVRHHLKKALNGRTVAVQGLGAVGMSLCAYLHEADVHLVVADVNEARSSEAAHRFGARVVDPDRIPFELADVLAPCALGATLNVATIPHIQAAIVAGAANNQLATLQDGDDLHGRGVLYLPDFLINAGGIVCVAREYLGTGAEESVVEEVGHIRDRVTQLLERAVGQAPARVAEAWAREKLRT